jgi:hypothetical protein
MQYDLNDNLFDPLVTKDEILETGVTEYDIFRLYLPNFILDTANKSPFRDDSVPSFGVTMRTGFLYWRDFATGESGNIWTLIARLFSTDYTGALKIIAKDLGIRNGTDFKKISENVKSFPIPERKQIELGIRTRGWKLNDKEYWTQYGINRSTLEKYLVSPIDYMFFNEHPVKAERHAYVYRELKDDILTFKIYQPYSKDRKWISNNNQSVWEGWSQLPETGDNLIITSSRKDLMSIIDSTKIPSISLQGESMMPKHHVVKQLVDRFNKVYVLYDNDFTNPKNPGRALGNKIATEFGLTQIEIPEEYLSKDFSDLVKNHGKINASNVLQNLIT